MRPGGSLERRRPEWLGASERRTSEEGNRGGPAGAGARRGDSHGGIRTEAVQGTTPGDAGSRVDAAVEHLGLADAAGGSEPSGPAPSPHFCPRCFYLGIRVGRHDAYLPPPMRLTLEEWIG